MPRLMTLCHTTPTANLSAILSRGLLTCASGGAKPVVWLAAVRLTAWAITHVAKHHRSQGLSTLTVQVPRTWLRKTAKRGVWLCVCNIHPRHFLGIDLRAGKAA